MMTPKMLRAELGRRNYHVSQRCLTDWRQKSLLPKLKRCGAGQGLGAKFFWVEENIVERALVICQVFACCRRTDVALLTLWFCGFDVTISKVRNLWLCQLPRARGHRRPNWRSKESESDWLWEPAEKVGRQLAVQGKMQSRSAEILSLNYLLGVLGSSKYKHTTDELAELKETARAVLAVRHISDKSVERTFGLFRAVASAHNAREQIRSARNIDLLAAQNYLRAFGRLVRAAALVQLNRKDHEIVLQEYRPRMAANFGPPMVRFFLKLIQSGDEWRLVHSAKVIEHLTASVESRLPDDKSSAVPGNLLTDEEIRVTIGKLINIWNDLDAYKLYGIR